MRLAWFPAWIGAVALLVACVPPQQQPPPTDAAVPGQSAAPAGMRRVVAGRGETCSQYVRWCVEWCTKNMSGSGDCLGSCKARGDSCLANGEWVVESESKVVTRLRPR